MGNDFVITNKNGTAYLDYFAPNDLPTRTKNGFSIKNIISFSKNSYIIFNSYEEASKAIKRMLQQCNEEDNIKRWNMVHWAADGYIKNFICNLKIKRI
jgi:hypothetical protein